MRGKRKVPVTYTCAMCGATGESSACQTPMYCKSCLEERRRECRRRYDRAHKEEHNARQRATRKFRPNYAEKNREYYLRRKAKPGFKEKQREASHKHYLLHRDKIRARSKAYHIAHREEIITRVKAYYREHAERIKEVARLRRIGKKDSNAAIAHRELIGRLQECPRMKIRAMHLPCGKREECFGKIPCPSCPKGVSPPSMSFNSL